MGYKVKIIEAAKLEQLEKLANEFLQDKRDIIEVKLSDLNWKHFDNFTLTILYWEIENAR